MTMKPLAWIRALELWMLQHVLYRRMGDLLERRVFTAEEFNAAAIKLRDGATTYEEMVKRLIE